MISSFPNLCAIWMFVFSPLYLLVQGFLPIINEERAWNPQHGKLRKSQSVGFDFGFGFSTPNVGTNHKKFTSLSMTAVDRSRSCTLSTGTTVNGIVPLTQGSTVALITPYTSNGDIDIPALRKLLQFHVLSHTDGICILGTTGEASLMSIQERQIILETTVQEVKGTIPIIAGTGSMNPMEVTEMTLQAKEIGCDAVLVVSPPYLKPPQRGLVKHFTSIADLGLPVIIYNVPSRTGVDMTPESISLCAEHDNIIGVKEATGDVSRVRSIRDLTEITRKDRPLLLYSGDDATEADFVLHGGDGCISVTANIVPAAMHELMMVALQGNTKKVQNLSKTLEMLHERIFCESNPIPVKWALQKMGHIENAYCRPPLMELEDIYYEHVKEALAISGVI